MVRLGHNVSKFNAQVLTVTHSLKWRLISPRFAASDIPRISGKCKNVEKVLLRHVQITIDETYLEDLVDEDTSLINDKLPTVLDYLFTKYGTVQLEETKTKEQEVLNLTL